jgi:hypothetical protein
MRTPMDQRKIVTIQSFNAPNCRPVGVRVKARQTMLQRARTNILVGTGHIRERKCLYKPHTSARRVGDSHANSGWLYVCAAVEARAAWRRSGAKHNGYHASQ